MERGILRNGESFALELEILKLAISKGIRLGSSTCTYLGTLLPYSILAGTSPGWLSSRPLADSRLVFTNSLGNQEPKLESVGPSLKTKGSICGLLYTPINSTENGASGLFATAESILGGVVVVPI